MYIKDNLINSKKYIILFIYGFILFLFGIVMDTPNNVISGLLNIIKEPDVLITDYIVVGGIGAAFVNSGLLTIIFIFILKKLNINISGASISAILMMSGFSLFGENIFNVWFIVIGVMLYAKYQKEKFYKYVYIAILGTGLSPIVTQIMFNMDKQKFISIPFSILLGIGLGFILPPLSASLMKVHQGFNLYNIGFTSGIIGTILVSILRSYGFSIQGRIIWSGGNNVLLSIFLSFIFLSMIIVGFILNKKSFKGLKRIFTYSGRLVTDFVLLEGFPITLINMGINGVAALLYVLIVGGNLNGPTIGGIFTIVGFGAFGKHIKNILPIFLGVFIAGVTKIWNINDPAVLLSSLFGTTLAPISGEFGWKYGILAGFIICSVTINVGYLHGGLNLYNVGFAGGIVAAFLIPVIEALRKDES